MIIDIVLILGYTILMIWLGSDEKRLEDRKNIF